MDSRFALKPSRYEDFMNNVQRIMEPAKYIYLPVCFKCCELFHTPASLTGCVAFSSYEVGRNILLFLSIVQRFRSRFIFDLLDFLILLKCSVYVKNTRTALGLG